MQFSKPFFSFLVQLISLLPDYVHNFIHSSNNLHSNELSFNVSKNSLWVGYKIKNESRINNLLPSNLKLAPVQVFHYSKEKHPMIFFNFFTVDSEYFSGNRLEIVTVARDIHNNKNRFVILEYFSDTISSDPEHLFKLPNAEKMNLYSEKNNILAYCDNMYHIAVKTNDLYYNLSKEFAIDCNENIYYGTKKKHLPNFLTFDHQEISWVKKVKIEYLFNNLWNETRFEKPFYSFYYPQEIHFKIIPEKLIDKKLNTNFDFYNQPSPMDYFCF